jgi:hypothetical protein
MKAPPLGIVFVIKIAKFSCSSDGSVAAELC